MAQFFHIHIVLYTCDGPLFTQLRASRYYNASSATTIAAMLRSEIFTLILLTFSSRVQHLASNKLFLFQLSLNNIRASSVIVAILF